MLHDIIPTWFYAYLILRALHSLQTTTRSAPKGPYFLQINRSLKTICKHSGLPKASVISLTYTADFHILERELRTLSLDFAIDYNQSTPESNSHLNRGIRVRGSKAGSLLTHHTTVYPHRIQIDSHSSILRLTFELLRELTQA